jgi:hypothetical protein
MTIVAGGTIKRMKGHPAGLRARQNDSAVERLTRSLACVMNGVGRGKAPSVCFACWYILAGVDSEEVPWSVM